MNFRASNKTAMAAGKINRLTHIQNPANNETIVAANMVAAIHVDITIGQY